MDEFRRIAEEEGPARRAEHERIKKEREERMARERREKEEKLAKEQAEKE